MYIQALQWPLCRGHAPRTSSGTKLRNSYGSASDRCRFDQRRNLSLVSAGRTQRDVYILNFAVTLYSLQLDAYTVFAFLYGPLATGHPDYTATFSLQYNFLIQTPLTSGHPTNVGNDQGWMTNLHLFSQSQVNNCNSLTTSQQLIKKA